MTDPAAPTTPEPFNFVRDTDGVLVQDDRHKIGHWLPAWAYHALRSKWQSEAEAGSRLGSTTGNAGLTPSRDVSDGLELRDAPSASRSTPAEALAHKIADRMAQAYNLSMARAADVAKACDESIDPTGNLLGWLREYARLSSSESDR